MSEEIKSGDLVVCINARPCPVYGPTDLVLGGIYRVTMVKAGTDRRTGVGGIGLKLDRHNARGGLWCSVERFRKLNDEPDNTELVERIKRCRPMPAKAREPQP